MKITGAPQKLNLRVQCDIATFHSTASAWPGAFNHHTGVHVYIIYMPLPQDGSPHSNLLSTRFTEIDPGAWGDGTVLKVGTICYGSCLMKGPLRDLREVFQFGGGRGSGGGGSSREGRSGNRIKTKPSLIKL